MSAPLAPLRVTMPDEPSVVVVAVRLEDASGTVLHRNFTTFVVEGEPPAERDAGRWITRARGARAARPPSATRAGRSGNGPCCGDRKLNGAGSGFFEYRIAWPTGLDPRSVAGATFLVEASVEAAQRKGS